MRISDWSSDVGSSDLDTSEENYSTIISTRTYEDRLHTLEHVRKANITVCSGGIIGMGETEEDRIGMLHTLSSLPEHPQSVPVNALVPVKGTPLENQPRVPVQDMVRMVANARIIRSEERRVGKECVSKGRSRGSPYT